MLDDDSGQEFEIRMRRSGEETEYPTFSDGMKKVRDFVLSLEQGGGSVVYVGHNIGPFDIANIRKQLKETGEESLWPERPSFDTLLLSRKVHPHKRCHKLIRLTHKYGIRGGAHTALEDCRTNRDVLTRMLHPLSMDQVYPLIGRTDAIKVVTEMFEKVQLVTAVHLDLTLTAPVKKNKLDEGENPEIIRMQATAHGQTFDTLVKPKKKITTTEGVLNRSVSAKKLRLFLRLLKLSSVLLEIEQIAKLLFLLGTPGKEMALRYQNVLVSRVSF